MQKSEEKNLTSRLFSVGVGLQQLAKSTTLYAYCYSILYTCRTQNNVNAVHYSYTCITYVRVHIRRNCWCLKNYLTMLLIDWQKDEIDDNSLLAWSKWRVSTWQNETVGSFKRMQTTTAKS